MKARKFYQRTSKKILINGRDTAGYDKKKVECFNCHKLGHFARECRNPKSQENRSRRQNSSRRTVNVEEASPKAMLTIDGLFVPPCVDLSSSGIEKFKEPKFEGYGVKVTKSASEDVSKEVKKTSDAPIIEDWVSDCDEDETVVLESLNVQKPKQADQPKKQGINAVKPTAYWAWRPKVKMINHVYKNTGFCVCKQFDYVDPTEAKDSEVCKITRADGTSSFHGDFQVLLRRLDRQDLFQLYSLVQERYKHRSIEGHDLDLCRDLKMMFDPNKEDDIWLNQYYWELLRWKLHEYSGVHSLFLDGASIQINMLVDKKYPLKKEILKKMISLKIKAEEESDMASELIKFIKSQIAEQS
ncbi:ribonuclease H-like domain-containing protein [Tanacetum coccineum]